MSQSVERLKELLFDSETTALQDLAQRLERVSESELKNKDELSRRIDGIADLDARARAELKAKLDEVYAQAGNTEQLTHSVSQIISEVLRRAEVERHAELSQSLAPLLVSTIKTELRNSQDQMVEALYPITGRLAKSYVASAIQDLTAQMNRRLEQNAVMLRLQSLATGRSVAELALASTNDFAVKELYLIRRGSGALIAHWPETGSNGREHAVSGVLAAVNEFANEAFSANEQNLRQIDLGGEIVYLRGSPVYLLAARCSGQAPAKIAQSVDDALLSAVERQLAIDAKMLPGSDTTAMTSAGLRDVGQTLTQEIEDQIKSNRRSGATGALKFIATLVLLPLIGWLAWTWYGDYLVAQTRAVAERVIAAEPAMRGYPVRVAISGAGKQLTISGLTPSQEAKQRIVSVIKERLPATRVDDQTSVVAGSGIVVPDVSPELARVHSEIAATRADLTSAALTRANNRAAARLDRAARDLKSAAALQTEGVDTASLQRIATSIEALRVSMGPSANHAELTAHLSALSNELLTAIGLPAGPSAATNSALATSPEIAAEQFAAETERIAALSSTIAAAKLLRPPPAPAPVTVTVPAEPTARDKLEAWTRSHAVFFSADLDYRNAGETAQWLSELAALLKSAPLLVRIVGYTDETGASERNVKLAQQRAAKVRADLLALGTPESKLVTVGRASALDLSDMRGTGTPNRRVQFELGFEGEAPQ